MMYYTKAIQVEAQQFTEPEHPELITLAQLSEPTSISTLGTFYIEISKSVRWLDIGDWIIRFPDGHLEILNDKEFQEKFRGYSVYDSLKESYDRLLWISGGVSSAIMGHIKDGNYEGKPIGQIEEALDLRKRVEVAEQLLLSLGGVIANYRKARDELIAKQGK